MAVDYGKPVAVPENPLWPLPEDYFEQDEETRRALRINGCRQYLVEGLSREDAAHAFARCNDFFDRYYLQPDKRGILRFDADANIQEWPDHLPGWPGAPIFYRGDFVNSPDYHYELDYQYWLNSSSMFVCPRGAGKSKKIAKRILLRMLAEPGHEVIYATSTHDNAADMGELLNAQFRNNPRVINDFGVPDSLTGEPRLVPRKGQGRFNMKAMRLLNDSVAKLSSIKSLQRGQRPHAYELDDPEADARTSTDMATRRAELERAIIHVIEPMLSTSGARLCWTGTFVSRQHLLWFAMQTEKRADGSEIAQDERFDYWSRFVVRLVAERPDGSRVSVWPEMFPIDDAERKRLKVHGRRTVNEWEQRLGQAAFRAEYMADPGGSTQAYFPFDRHSQETKQRFSWWLEQPDGRMPKVSQTLVCWHKWHSEDHYETIKVPMHQLLAECPPFVVLDTSYSSGPSSDYKVAHCMTMTPRGHGTPELLSLDLWAARCSEDVLVKKAFDMANEWGARRICPEYVRRQRGLYDVLMRTVKDRLYTRWGVTSAPAIQKFMVGFESKTSKIASLGLWFQHNLIKLPWARLREPAYQQLVSQIEQFNPEADNGGLQNDDHIDTLTMGASVSRVSPEALEALADDQQRDSEPLSMLKDGCVQDPESGLYYGAMLDYTQLTLADVLEIAKGVGTRGANNVRF